MTCVFVKTQTLRVIVVNGLKSNMIQAIVH